MLLKESYFDFKKKKFYEFLKLLDKMYKFYKQKFSSFFSVSEDVIISDISKSLKSVEKFKIFKIEYRSKNDNDKIVKKEIKVSKLEDEKKKLLKLFNEKKKFSKENKFIKFVIFKKKDKKEEKIEEYKLVEVVKKVVVDDDFDWDVW